MRRFINSEELADVICKFAIAAIVFLGGCFINYLETL